jgi:hypothetical protein
MKVTVELSDSDLNEVCRITGEKKKGPAIRKLVADALLLKRRERLVRKFLRQEVGVELKGFEATQAADRKTGEQLDKRWRK